MGTETSNINGNTNGQVNSTATGTGKGTSGGSTGSTNTGTRTGTDNGTRTRTNTGNETEKELPKLVTVTDEEQTAEDKRLERNRKRRERYQKEKAESGQTVKPRKVNKSKTNDVTVTSMTKEQMNALIVSTSAVVASRPNCSHWIITEKEADSITTPLLKMIAESEKLEVIAKNSNQIALVLACITIFAPRIFITIQQNNVKTIKEKKPDARPEQTTKTENSNQLAGNVNDGKPAVADIHDDYMLSWED